MLRSGDLREPVYATGPKSQDLEELQFTLGEGPGVDALEAGGPVLAADLAAARAARRWPAFAPAAAQCGARAIYAIPIAAGAMRLGVLDVYRANEGLPSSTELADTLIFADAIMVLAIDGRGGVATGLEELIEVSFAERRAHVHQAAGMVAAQLEVNITDALARLRAHAYLSVSSTKAFVMLRDHARAGDGKLLDVARAVVDGKLRIEVGGRPPSRSQ
jgi:hypothetical protein